MGQQVLTALLSRAIRGAGDAAAGTGLALPLPLRGSWFEKAMR